MYISKMPYCPCPLRFLWFFTVRLHVMQRTVFIAVAILSVCLSYITCIVIKLNDELRIFWHHTPQSLLFSDTNIGWWSTPPSLWNLRSLWPTPFGKCQLQPISVHNVSTIRDSEESSVTTNIKSTVGFPTSYRWNEYIRYR